jgi:hypothetical protein
MSDGWKVVLFIIAAIVAISVLVKVFWWLIGLIIPIAVVAGLGFVLYQFVARKPLGGRSRTMLP